WTVAPAKVIEAVASAGSFLDGGGSRPLQRAAIPLLTEEGVQKETLAINAAFREKRDRMIQRLDGVGNPPDPAPGGTFYVWGNLSALPPPLNDGMGFFRAALEKKVITVPGEFFDVNPGKRRSRRASRFRSYSRFSFGAPQPQLEEALARMQVLISSGA